MRGRLRVNYEISVTFEGDHVAVHADGEKDYQAVEEIWSRVARTCEKHQCFDVLGIANSSKSIEAVEGYEIPAVFRTYGIDRRYRIAWVELNPDAVDVIELAVNILANRDLPGRRFDTVDQARDWLSGNEDRQ